MSKQTVAIIDYGMGNLHSVASAVQRVAPECEVRVVDKPDNLASADRVIFPGVGAIRDCIAEIKLRGFDSALMDYIKTGKPVLGICVGMQALLDFSEENEGIECLGYFSGTVRNFDRNAQFKQTRDEGAASGERLKVPHMGWNQVKQTQAHALWQGIEDNTHFYFVHSYYLDCDSAVSDAGITHYGVDFKSAVAKDNVFAVQFHPEKSHTSGLRLLENFVAWQPSC